MEGGYGSGVLVGEFSGLLQRLKVVGLVSEVGSWVDSGESRF